MKERKGNVHHARIAPTCVSENKGKGEVSAFQATQDLQDSQDSEDLKDPWESKEKMEQVDHREPVD